MSEQGPYVPSALVAAAFPYLSQTCWCGSCDNKAADLLAEGDIRRICRRMNLCPSCGNKRCPRSWDHVYACTGSNEPGQVPTVAKPRPVADGQSSDKRSLGVNDV
jgi:hypothetical protein